MRAGRMGNGRRRVPLAVLLALGLACGACTSGAPRPHRLTATGVAPAVWGVLETPQTPGPHDAVILLPGSYGWRSDYARFARAFADAGLVALAIDYYAETGRGGSRAEEQRNWPAWQATVRNAVAYLDTMSQVAGRHIGLVGYSRGAFLAVSVAGSMPAVRAVVDFYGGGSDSDPAVGDIPRFPPLLILHGEADTEVPVELAHRLYDRMRAHGGKVEMHLYPGAGHVFNAPWAATYSPPDAADAWRRTIEFLGRQLAR